MAIPNDRALTVFPARKIPGVEQIYRIAIPAAEKIAETAKHTLRPNRSAMKPMATAPSIVPIWPIAFQTDCHHAAITGDPFTISPN